MRTSRILPLAVLSCLAVLGAAPAAPGQPTPAPKFEIVRADPRLDAIVPADARIELLADGFDWSEGPVWFPDDGGYLLFSDVPRNVVHRFRDGHGVDVFLRPSGYTGTTPRGGEPGSNGLARDGDGQLVLMQHGDRRVARLTREGWTYQTLADRYEGKRFNSPNDGVFSSAGDFYFTDPPYGLPKNVDDPTKELDFQGVYRLRKGGALELLTREITRPNGIALSPDEKTLYVNNSDPERAVCMAFPIGPDGKLGSGRVFFDRTEDAKRKLPGLPDGLKVDQRGNLFATGPGGVLIYAPDGTHLGTFAMGVPTANCAFGDDGSTLYITADSYLARVRLSTKGVGF